MLYVCDATCPDGSIFSVSKLMPPRHRSDFGGPDPTKPLHTPCSFYPFARLGPGAIDIPAVMLFCCPGSSQSLPLTTLLTPTEESLQRPAFRPDGLYLSPLLTRFAFGSRKLFGLEPIDHSNLIPVESMESNPTPPFGDEGTHVMPFPLIPMENVNAQPVHRHSHHRRHRLQRSSFIERPSHALTLLGPREGRATAFVLGKQPHHQRDRVVF
jgi:hypothetical protein